MAALLVMAIFISGATSSTALSITSMQTLHTFEVQPNSPAFSGPKAPTATSVYTGFGNIGWSNPDAVKLEDGSFAYTSQTGGYYYSYVLKTSGYGFNVPASAVITGIKVEFKCYQTAASSDTCVAVGQMLKAGALTGVNRGNYNQLLPTSLGWMSYGNSTDLWGATWTPSDVNDNGFGLGLAFRMLSGGVYVDAARITLYYNTITVSNSQNQLFNMTASEVQQTLTQYSPLLDQLKNATSAGSFSFANTTLFTHIQMDRYSNISISNITLPSMSVGSVPGAPTAVSQDTSFGNLSWTNLNGVESENGSCAYTARSGNNYYSYILRTYGYNFSIPTTATITGINVEFRCNASTSGTQVAANQLYKASGRIGLSRTGATLPTSLNWMSYGNQTDLWGATWTPSDVNNGAFGVGLAFRMLSGGVYVDAVGVTVSYIAYQSTTGTGTPGTAAEDTSFGTQSWTSSYGNLQNIKASDGAYAGATTSAVSCTKYTYYAKVTNFGFNIPANSIVTGIRVGIRKCGHYGISTNYQTDYYLYAVKGGTIQTGGTNKADRATHWTADQDLWYSYGNSSDLWGLSWTPSDVNSTGFGVAFAAMMYAYNGCWGVASVDAINITVYYAVIAGQGPKAPNTTNIPGFPGTAAEDVSFGTQSWTSSYGSLQNIEASDGAYAAAVNTVMQGAMYSHYAVVTNFGFNIPLGATVTGIRVGIEKFGHYGISTNYQTDYYLYAVKGGTIQTGGTNKADRATHWTADQDLWYSYGNSSDLWGLSWTPNDINSAGFGMAFAAKMYANDGCWGVASVDAINATVYYTTRLPGTPGTAAEDSGFGTQSWTSSYGNLQNIMASDGAYAASVNNVMSGAMYSHYAVVTNFGFNIPLGATVTGIRVGIQKCGHYCTSTNYQTDYHLYAVKGGTIQTSGSDKANTTTHWTADQDLWYRYGGSSDLWGLSWTASDINSGGFGVAFAAMMNSTNGCYGVASVDAINVTVCYTAPPQGTPNTQTFLVINYRSNATSYFVRITTVATFANGAYQSCATFLNYASPQFNATHWIGDYLIFNFTHTLAQHYSLMADALSNIANNTYAPLAQQNQTAYQLVIAYTALAQHARRLANFTVAHLQAYNKQITQAMALVTDPGSRPIIPDVDVPLRGGGRIPAGGSGTLPTTASQGSSPPPGANYIWQTSIDPPKGLTWEELAIFGIQFVDLLLICYVPSLAGIYSAWTDGESIFAPLILNTIATFVPIIGLVQEGRLGIMDLFLALMGTIIAIVVAYVQWVIMRDIRNYWRAVSAIVGFTIEVGTGIPFALATIALIIGAIYLFFTLFANANN